jgi:hypothetical protein
MSDKNMTPSEKYALECFEKAFKKAKTITYNPKWENGTGYFSNAVSGEDAPHLEEGEVVSTFDTIGRDMIIIGTVFGNVVIFQRYDNRRDIFSYNAPGDVEQLLKPFLSSKLSPNAMSSLLGETNGFSNVGERIRLSMQENNHE